MELNDDGLDVLGSAGSGALTGLMTGGPIGALVGGVASGLGSLFSGKKKKRKFNDPFEAKRAALVNELSNTKIGEQQAQIASRQAGNMARDQMEALNNDPGLAGNANVLTAANDKLLSSAADATSSAYLAGAQQDNANKLRAADLSLQGSNAALNVDQYNDALDTRQSFGETIGQNILSTGAGYGLSSLFNQNQPAGSGGGLKDNSKNTIGAQMPQSDTGLIPEGQSITQLLSGILNPTPASNDQQDALNGNGGLPEPYPDPMAKSDDLDYLLGRRSNLNPFTGNYRGLSSITQ